MSLKLATATPGQSDKKIKAALFDGDGVVIHLDEQRLFFRTYAEERKLDLENFYRFFNSSEWADVLRGKMDLQELVSGPYADVWQWQNDPQELFEKWFAAESLRNEPLLEVIAKKRSEGVAMYMATVQERQRLRHIKEKVFPGVFDNIFATCELGFLKVESEDRPFFYPQSGSEHQEETIEEFKERLGRLASNEESLGPQCAYFSRILGGLALHPSQIAYFDDRPDNIKAALYKGFDAHIYESPEQVERILSA